MKAKDLFTIILKVLGIYLIKDLLLSIPPVLSNLIQMFEYSADMAFFSLFISLLILGFYFVIVYLLLFKTDLIISKLQLTSNLSDEPLIVNLHRSSIYTIAIIITGLVILTFAIPQLVRHFYAWYDYVGNRKGRFGVEYFDYTHLLTSLSEVIIGLLFLGNQRTIVNFIESRRRESKKSNIT